MTVRAPVQDSHLEGYSVFMKAACSSGLSFGGGVVLVATFTPSSIKKFSEPAGEQMHRRRAALEELLWNWCGAFEGMLMAVSYTHLDVYKRQLSR